MNKVASSYWVDARIAVQNTASARPLAGAGTLDARAGARRRAKTRRAGVSSFAVFGMVLVTMFVFCLTVTLRTRAEAQTAATRYAEVNAEVQAAAAVEAGRELGIDVKIATIANSSEVQQAAESLDVELTLAVSDSAQALTCSLARAGDRSGRRPAAPARTERPRSKSSTSSGTSRRRRPFRGPFLAASSASSPSSSSSSSSSCCMFSSTTSIRLLVADYYFFRPLSFFRPLLLSHPPVS